MALTPKSRRNPTGRLVTFALAGGVPLAAYLATASAHGYWLDAGEFVAASAELGISHPPGHPLAALVGHLATLVPLGPLALRVALASAVLTAAAAGFLFSAIETTVHCLGVQRDRVAVPLALGATWLVAGSFGWWFQAVRPEVYALQAALVCLAIERTVALEAAWPTHDVRPAYVASLAIGLALANHHFLAFLTLPAMAPTLARVRRAKGMRPVAISAGCVLVGLSTYVYLPVRAAVGPALNLGEPTTLSKLFWVVSAQAFQKNTGGGVPQPMAERFADIAVQLVEQLHWGPLLLAVGGIYVLLRAPGTRRVGTVWVAVLVFFIGARAWLGFVRSNPDALGYLMPAYGAVGALAAAFVAATLTTVGGADRAKPGWIAVAVAWLVAGMGLAQIHFTEARASLEAFTATDAFEEVSRRELPARAVVLAHDPQTVFRHWGGETSELLRPDTVLVPMPFLTYPGLVNALVDRDPELAGLLRGYLLEGELRVPDLQSLAAQRPVLIEMDARVSPALYETIVPHGIYHEVLPDSAYDDDRQQGRQSQRAQRRWLATLLKSQARERETQNHLLWGHYMSALYYAGTGDREAAREDVAAGRALNPQATELIALQRALAPSGEEDEGPIDVTPFMPRRLD